MLPLSLQAPVPPSPLLPADAPPSSFPSVVEALIQFKTTKIRPSFADTNRASSLGDPCERYLVYERTHAHEKGLHDVATQFLFDEGFHHERAVLRDLDDASIQVIETQRDYAYTPFKITGHIDGKAVLEDVAYPFDIKSCSPHVFQKISTVDDLLSSKWRHHQRYPAQLQIYLLMSNCDAGFLLFKNKVSGQCKELWMTLDYDYTEALLKKAERINAHVNAGTLPDRIPYTEGHCHECPYVQSCTPPVEGEGGMVIATDPELIAKVARHQTLKALVAEFKKLESEIKTAAGHQPFLQVGDYLIPGAWAERRMGARPAQTTEYWKMKIQAV